MTFEPMLAQTLDIRVLDTYPKNQAWWVEQKIDGTRQLIIIKDGKVMGTNRKGESNHVSAALIEQFESFGGDWIFDGEIANDQFNVFDMPLALDKISPETHFSERRRALEAVAEVAWGPRNPLVNLIPVARTMKEKREMIAWARDNNIEGVMLKMKSAPYLQGTNGKRSKHMLKAKFTETVDCIVLEPRREGKASTSVTLYHHGQLLAGTNKEPGVGSCKMTEEELQRAKPGDVVELRYLYSTSNLKLVQPVFLRFRDDKDPEECTTDQLKLTNKTVRKAY